MRRPRPGAIARRLSRAEDGFTMIEVLVAAMILVAGSFAVLMTFVMGIHNVERGKNTQVGVSVAQREMEKVRSLSYNEVALAPPLPATSADAANPDHRVSGGNFYLQRDRTEPAPLCVAGSGECSADVGRVVKGPAESCVDSAEGSSFEVGGGKQAVKGQVYCFVTLKKDPACEAATGKACSFKRVVVDVWLDKLPSEPTRRSYYELQSDFVEAEE
jgi:type II secretory pathway pseudopilin PulG